MLIGGAIAGLITALGFSLRTYSTSRAYREGKQADSRSDATVTIAEIAKSGQFFQQKMIDVVEGNTRAFGEYAARMQGMLIFMDDHKTILKDLVVGVDDVSGQLSKIRSSVDKTQDMITTTETNLINDQFSPIVNELKIIGASITDLTSRFQRAEAYLMKTMEPLVLAQLKITTQEVVTLTPPIETNHKETVNP